MSFERRLPLGTQLAVGELRSMRTLRGRPMLCPFTIAAGAQHLVILGQSLVHVHLFWWTVTVVCPPIFDICIQKCMPRFEQVRFNEAM